MTTDSCSPRPRVAPCFDATSGGANRLGHSSIKVTLDTYGHLFQGLDEAAAERLDAAFEQTPVPLTSDRGRERMLEMSG
jgi:hypothetical protein